ncbi:LPXTG cell wall anchor domain-containing protein [Nocardioides sp. W3-2-3]|nr:LPXTG cell wall anchor domain-containing protein [Nocardioides convexus]
MRTTSPSRPASRTARGSTSRPVRRPCAPSSPSPATPAPRWRSGPPSTPTPPARLQQVPFRVLLNLEEDGSVGGIDQGNGGGNGDGSVGGVEDGGLPATGSAVAPGLVWLAAGLIGGGLALVRRRTRGEVPRG